MKTLAFTLLLVLMALGGWAQTIRFALKLPYKAVLIMRQAPFQAARHRLGYYQPAGRNRARFVETIDGRRFFGSDGEVPRSQLVGASLLLNGIRYQLPVSGMYNPWFGGAPDPRFFRLAKGRQGYQLWAMFSDGAGGYAAKWQLKGNTAKRIVLSNDEQYAF